MSRSENSLKEALDHAQAQLRLLTKFSERSLGGACVCVDLLTSMTQMALFPSGLLPFGHPFLAGKEMPKEKSPASHDAAKTKTFTKKLRTFHTRREIAVNYLF